MQGRRGSLACLDRSCTPLLCRKSIPPGTLGLPRVWRALMGPWRCTAAAQPEDWWLWGGPFPLPTQSPFPCLPLASAEGQSIAHSLTSTGGKYWDSGKDQDKGISFSATKIRHKPSTCQEDVGESNCNKLKGVQKWRDINGQGAVQLCTWSSQHH